MAKKNWQFPVFSGVVRLLKTLLCFDLWFEDVDGGVMNTTCFRKNLPGNAYYSYIAFKGEQKLYCAIKTFYTKCLNKTQLIGDVTEHVFSVGIFD